jgi:hypothetical protein
MLPVSDIKGSDDKQYREYIRKLSSKGYDIFMVPLQVPSLNISETGMSLSTTMIKDLVIDLVKKVRPIYTFVTLEGQPEARIFASKIAEDQSLSQWLNASDMIFAMVRFDSEERFYDSISIPAIISRNTTWKKRLKLVLTRVSTEPKIPNGLEEYLLGSIPFADFIGESVNSGRIPLINVWCHDYEMEIGSDTNKYLKCIDSVTERIKAILIPHRTPEEYANNTHKL